MVSQAIATAAMIVGKTLKTNSPVSVNGIVAGYEGGNGRRAEAEVSGFLMQLLERESQVGKSGYDNFKILVRVCVIFLTFSISYILRFNRVLGGTFRHCR